MIRDGEVRTGPDWRRMSVTYRRFDEDYVDSDLTEMKAVFPYVPEMIERYFGEEPILQNAPIY